MVRRTELWKSDGTAGGTVLVKDINPNAADPGILEMVAVNGVLYFNATDGTHGRELWRSDGTTNGTTMIEIVPGPNNSAPHHGLADVNGTLYFGAIDSEFGDQCFVQV